MSIVKCKICGTEFGASGASVGFCSSCGVKQTFPLINNEKMSELYLRADTLRMSGEYEKAMGLYEFIVAENPADAECYWRILLCRYGVSFSKDVKTNSVIITVGRPQNSTVFNDKDYKNAVFYADEDSRKIYEIEAHIIDEEQKKRLFGSSSAHQQKNTEAQGNDSASDSSTAEVAASLKRGFLFLEDGKWINAKIYFEKVLDREPDNGDAYLGKLMADMQVKDKEMLKNCPMPFDTNDNYRKLLRFADKKLAGEISDYNTFIKERNENGRLELAYNDAVAKLQNAKNENDCLLAAEAFSKILYHKDSAELKKKCYEKLEYLKCEEKYNKALEKMKKKKEDNLLEAASVFDEISSHKDSAQKAEECRALIKEIEETRELSELSYDNALSSIIKVCSILAVIVSVLMIVCFAVTSFAVPFSQYKKAEKLFNGGEMAEGLEILDSLNGFLGADEKIEELLEKFSVREKSDNPVYVMQDGTVFYSNGEKDKNYEFTDWDNIVEVDYYSPYIAGVTSDGKLLISPVRENVDPEDIPYVSHWKNIVDISYSFGHIVGLDKYGDVHAVATSVFSEDACEVGYWEDIIAVSSGSRHTVGLMKDGTVVSVAVYDKYSYYGQDAVYEWDNIVAVAAGSYHTVGLKADGTVVACGDNEDGQCDVNFWKDIIAIAAGSDYTVGLKADRTVVFTGDEENFPDGVENIDWDELYGVNKGYPSEIEIPEEEATEEETIAEETTAEETTAA